MQPLKWVSKSLAKLTKALQDRDHKIGSTTVGILLEKLGFSRQGNRKTIEVANHVDRNAQFEHINARVLACQAAGQPVISVDTKKKELIGNFKNGGTEWEPKGEPVQVNGHDFPKTDVPKKDAGGALHDKTRKDAIGQVACPNVSVVPSPMVLTADGGCLPGNATGEHHGGEVRERFAAEDGPTTSSDMATDSQGDGGILDDRDKPLGKHDGKEIQEGGKVVPYGIYDISANSGWVSVGINHDTAEFAVASIKRWHDRMGHERYPHADRLLVTADCGGSNGARVRLWKWELQRLADDTGVTIEVCHYPPGTSKWNKIEHRMFCHISQNWRARPLVSRMAVVELIAATTTTTGLTVAAELDTHVYEKGRKVSDAELATINIEKNSFHPEWNYVIRPRKPK